MADIHRDSLEEALRHALAELYDPLALRKSPFIEWLGLVTRANPASALRTVLVDAIESLKPTPRAPANATTQRYYQILSQRYVQQYTQQDVANQLGISPRHLRREQVAAIRALAEYLAYRYGLAGGDGSSMSANSEAPSLENGSDVEGEMLWLEDSQGDRKAEVWPVLEDAVHLAQALARQQRVVLLTGDCPRTLPEVAVAPTVLKQIILNLLTTGIQGAPCGEVALEVAVRHGRVVIGVRAQCVSGTKGRFDLDEAGIDMARRLAELFEGQVATAVEAGWLMLSASLPSIEQVIVLAVEDNVDTLQLWQRYLQDSRLCLIPVRDPAQALGTAVRLQPRLIILDVMMPGIDGWDLLAQLRHHPETSAIPIVVCTVLPQRELALSLGASGFIRKPMTRQAFRSELERQLEAEEPL